MPNRVNARPRAWSPREIINAIFYVVELHGDFSRATCRPHRLSWFSPMARRRSAGPSTTPRPPWVSAALPLSCSLRRLTRPSRISDHALSRNQARCTD
ncbi:MAG: hypothetical protein EOQ69_04285 [Mesorhizobium sp.]|nr:MAG: hypothetical protein EOQ28_06410 [Mesorhizobium sp.]RWB98616.1 MAG: hypothetical protein EOQ57_21660 [Mesorhizobium sp.]RWD97796.1 MAG: hypothetical protein EOS40_26835 [Mesorhizobium sp.]RWG80210.1 MAG: hypothetical protein EOQ70_27435 [Mesorhizobium sp.]RWG87414.1 MAG: hypothetical protein EOQ69_04285 [Mesorhizobium sp.]